MAGPTAAMGAAAGSSPPAAVTQADSRDDSAVIFCGSGASGATTGTYCTISLVGNYSATAVDDPAIPKVRVTFGYPTSAIAAAALAVSAITTKTITISAYGTPASAMTATAAGGISVFITMNN